LRRATTVLTFLATGNPTGLKFTVEHGATRCLFDFGREHAPGRAPFSLGLEPRRGRELDDLIALGEAPRIDGVYRDWDGRTSVFISHLHLDHTGLVRFLSPAVPLYYPAEMEELRSACAGSGYLAWREPAGTPVPDRGRIRCDEIEVEFVAVDHDLPGASGFLIRTPDLLLAFSGDHRRHGLHRELTERFVQAARGCDVLILECVSLGVPSEDTERRTEAEVATAFADLLRRTPGLVVANLYPMNRERVAAVGAVCRAAGRRLLLEPQAAAMAGWRDVLTDLAEVAADPSRHCIQFDFSSLPKLIDLNPPKGSVWVQCGGMPLGPFDPAASVLETWVKRFELELVHLSSSGHSFPRDLARTVQEVSPGVVLPVHSRAPDLLVSGGVPRLIPVPLRPYAAGELRSLRRPLRS
jgi:ribonuclease J